MHGRGRGEGFTRGRAAARQEGGAAARCGAARAAAPRLSSPAPGTPPRLSAPPQGKCVPFSAGEGPPDAQSRCRAPVGRRGASGRVHGGSPPILPLPQSGEFSIAGSCGWGGLGALHPWMAAFPRTPSLLSRPLEEFREDFSLRPEKARAFLPRLHVQGPMVSTEDDPDGEGEPRLGVG